MNDSNARATSLVLMLKAPQRSKRRLAGAIGDDGATAAAARLAACALEDLAEWPGPAWLAPADNADLDWLGEAAARHPAIPQGAGNLGSRIDRVSQALRDRGERRQIFIGIDCPELDGRYLRRAAGYLAEHDAVLGPALDGGVVLMGARVPWPRLEPLPWSTGALGAALLAACRADGLAVAALAPKADIDTFADLAGLATRLAHDERPARAALRRWLVETVGAESDV
jgi:uncharacterized protein